ncbi:MAG: RNA-binding protein [Deltaproteobacteria bacterium]|nr:MAG: RNA-binding protein [Deltaproteobacteria bacterium]
MSNKLFVGGLSWGTDDNSLRTAFATYGEVTDAKVILERDSGRSRGFGFVTFAEANDAQAAIAGLDGAELDGRAIRVNVAEQKSGGRRDNNRGGDRGGDRGGYGRGRRDDRGW